MDALFLSPFVICARVLNAAAQHTKRCTYVPTNEPTLDKHWKTTHDLVKFEWSSKKIFLTRLTLFLLVHNILILELPILKKFLTEKCCLWLLVFISDRFTLPAVVSGTQESFDLQKSEDSKNSFFFPEVFFNFPLFSEIPPIVSEKHMSVYRERRKVMVLCNSFGL